MPLLALAGTLVARRPHATRGPWIAVVVFAVLLPFTSWAALATGQQQEDVVERVVSEGAIHGHEEAAEGFLAGAGVLAVVVLLGLAPGVVGRAARVGSVAVAVGVLALGYRVGASGGELVYTHGAASAYVGSNGTPPGPFTPARSGGREEEDHEGRSR
jgi:hypothetical protein